jgi:hypothetical protein
MSAIHGNNPISLEKLFPNIRFSKSAGKIMVQLNQIKNVWTAQHKIPGKNYGDLSSVEARISKGEVIDTIDITTGDAILVNGGKAKSFDICFVLEGRADKLLLAIQVKHTEIDANESSTLSVDLFKDEQKKSTKAMKQCYFADSEDKKFKFKQMIFITISNRDEGVEHGSNEELDYQPSQSQAESEEVEEGAGEEEEEDKDQAKASKLLSFLGVAKEPIGLVFRPNFKQFLTHAFDSFVFLKRETVTSNGEISLFEYPTNTYS